MITIIIKLFSFRFAGKTWTLCFFTFPFLKPPKCCWILYKLDFCSFCSFSYLFPPFKSPQGLLFSPSYHSPLCRSKWSPIPTFSIYYLLWIQYDFHTICPTGNVDIHFYQCHWKKNANPSPSNESLSSTLLFPMNLSSSLHAMLPFRSWWQFSPPLLFVRSLFQSCAWCMLFR